MNEHTFVFVGGLHRSGTSLLHECLQEHPAISGFRDTGHPEDEGQFLQTVYPPARKYGGPGRFGFHPEAHLTEATRLVSEENRRKLFSEWARYWDLGKPFLIEKSPPNLIRCRFLQAMFPRSYFVIVTRHPLAVSYATQKWSASTLASLLEHWFVCHELFERDRARLDNVLVLRYEDFVSDAQACLGRIYAFLGLEGWPTGKTVRPDVNKAYFERWGRQSRDGLRSRLRHGLLRRRFEGRANRFGYSLYDLER